MTLSANSIGRPPAQPIAQPSGHHTSWCIGTRNRIISGVTNKLCWCLSLSTSKIVFRSRLARSSSSLKSVRWLPQIYVLTPEKSKPPGGAVGIPLASKADLASSRGTVDVLGYEFDYQAPLGGPGRPSPPLLDLKATNNSGSRSLGEQCGGVNNSGGADPESGIFGVRNLHFG